MNGVVLVVTMMDYTRCYKSRFCSYLLLMPPVDAACDGMDFNFIVLSAAQHHKIGSRLSTQIDTVFSIS